jgi:hypothetical protein
MVREIKVLWDVRTRIPSKVREMFTVLHGVTCHENCLFANQVMTLIRTCGMCDICVKYSIESLLYLCSRQVLSFFSFRTYTGCPGRNVKNFGRVFLLSKYTDITQNTYIQSWTVTEIMDREKCGLLWGRCTVAASWQPQHALPSVWYRITSRALSL